MPSERGLELGRPGHHCQFSRSCGDFGLYFSERFQPRAHEKMRHAPCSLSNLSLAYQETTHPNGAIGGLQVGHNWQSTPNWIFGIEADIQASGEGASGNAQQSGPQTLVAASISCVPSCGNPRNSTSISQSISQNGSLLWFGTVRGRIGYAIWPTVMLYGTGGLAYGRLNESVSAFNGSCTTNVPPCGGSIGFGNGTVLSVPFSVGQSFETAVTKTGWTVGGGVEGVVPNTHVTWKAEYLYMDLGTQNYTFSNPLLGTILVNTHFTDNIVRVGLSYQFH